MKDIFIENRIEKGMYLFNGDYANNSSNSSTPVVYGFLSIKLSSNEEKPGTYGCNECTHLCYILWFILHN